MSGNLTTDIQSLLQFFESRVTERSATTRRAYQQALATFKGYLQTLQGEEYAISPFTVSALADWCINMYLSGLTSKTIGQYLNVISALYGAAVKEGLAVPTEAFSVVKEALSGIDWSHAITEDDFARMQKVTKSAPLQKGDLGIATDLLLMSLLQGARPLTEIADLRREDTKLSDSTETGAGEFANLATTEAELDLYNLAEYNPEIADEIEALIARRSDPRRKYIFDLNQSRLTPRQLDKKVNGMLLDLLRLRNIPLYNNVKTTIDSYWAFAALRAGATPTDILSLLRYVPAGVPILSLALPVGTDVPKFRQLAINEVVASVFIENPLRWYAMKLRPYVKFDELVARFKALETDKVVKTPDIFYPYEEIAKKIGKKLVFDKKPIIRDIVFFRSRVTDIYPMFTKIGDLAWCYTTQGRTGKTYAAIPNSSFMVFQKTIGYFTPDYKVAPIGALAPLPGEKIVVVGGLFSGTTATFTGTVDPSSHKSNSHRSSSNGIPSHSSSSVKSNTPSSLSSHSIENSRTESQISREAQSTQDSAEETTTSILYRLNFISDNGIEWRINVDSRQVAH